MDVGVIFLDENLFGIDLVILDYIFLENNKFKVKGLFVIYGYEDYIGGIFYLYEKIEKDIVIYVGKLINVLIKFKFENFGVKKVLLKMVEVGLRSKVSVGKYFIVEFVKVIYLIVDLYCLFVKILVGYVFLIGDFKIDLIFVDNEKVDFMRLLELGEEGVDLMLLDLINFEVEGFIFFERSVGDVFR